MCGPAPRPPRASVARPKPFSCRRGQPLLGHRSETASPSPGAVPAPPGAPKPQPRLLAPPLSPGQGRGGAPGSIPRGCRAAVRGAGLVPRAAEPGCPPRSWEPGCPPRGVAAAVGAGGGSRPLAASASVPVSSVSVAVAAAGCVAARAPAAHHVLGVLHCVCGGGRAGRVSDQCHDFLLGLEQYQSAAEGSRLLLVSDRLGTIHADADTHTRSPHPGSRVAAPRRGGKMSSGDVVCTGWLIKSPPEKKLKRYVSAEALLIWGGGGFSLKGSRHVVGVSLFL